jgi:ribose/xylose/arabinose/galactoside ABC-type transport system permease subunit
MSLKQRLPYFDQTTALLAAGLLLFLVLTSKAGTNSDALAIFNSVLSYGLPLVLVALGESFVISLGDIDLSPSGLICLSGMGLVTLNAIDCPAPLAFLVLFVFALGIGALQGYLIAYRAVSPLVLTLGTTFLLMGVAMLLAVILQEKGIPCTLPRSYLPRPLSWHMPWLFIIAVPACWWRFHTLKGLQHLAVGMKRSSARLAPLPVCRLRLAGFIAASLCSVLGACMLISYQNGGCGSSDGQFYELYGIAAAVIGGTSIVGGVLSPLNVVLASLLISAIRFYLLARFPGEWHGLVFGVLLIAIAVVPSPRARAIT